MSEGWEEDAVLVTMRDAGCEPITNAQMEEVKAWLAPTDYAGDDSELARHHAAYVEGTGAWVHATEAFTNWLSSDDDGLLWICGIPGSGKSVIAAREVKMLREMGRPVFYFFFRHVVEANRTMTAALRDWLHQLLPHSISIQLKLLKYNKGSQNINSIDPADLWRCLELGLAEASPCFIVADALDEMTDGGDFASALIDLARLQPKSVKFIATSRPVPHVQDPMRRAGVCELLLDEQHVDVDISTYVQHRLTSSHIPTSLHAKVKQEVPGRASGLFLYAKLAMDTLTRPDADPEAALSSLPQNLEEMYTSLLRENADRSGISFELQKIILQFVIHAIRPLRLLELGECLAYFLDDTFHGDVKQAKEAIRSSCGSLIEIVPNETISIVHFSLAEFLADESRLSNCADGYPALGSAEAHMQLVIKCLSYLNQVHMQEENIDIPFPRRLHWHHVVANDRLYIEAADADGNADDMVPMLQGFARYACFNWPAHASIAMKTSNDTTQAQLISLLDYAAAGTRPSRLYALWPGCEYIALESDSMTPLVTAVGFRLHRYAEIVLSRDNADTRQLHDEELPLFERVCSLGWTDIVNTLLQHGAQVNRWNMDVDETTLTTPLVAAAYGGHLEVVTLLLQHGADPNLWFERPLGPIGPGGKRLQRRPAPFVLEAAANHLGIVKLVSPMVCSATHISAALGTAIERYRNIDVIKHLCQHPLANINQPCYSNARDTPIMLASKVSDPTSVKYLLNLGADPSLCPPAPPGHDLRPSSAIERWARGTESGCTELQAAETLRFLIEAGVNVNRKDQRGRTPLDAASNAMRTKLLLAAGARDPRGAIALLRDPIEPEQLDALVQRAVLEAKVHAAVAPTVSDTNLGESSIVLAAIKMLHVMTAIRLIEAGLDVMATDSDGNTCLHYAVSAYAERWHARRFIQTRRNERQEDADCARLVSMLCDAGIAVNGQNSKGQTPLHFTTDGPAGGSEVSSWRPVIMSKSWDVLAERGADFNARCNSGETPLFTLVKKSGVSIESMQWMVDHGASTTVKDNDGRNLIFATPNIQSHDSIMELNSLVSHNVDATDCDDAGNTLYNALLQRGNITKDVFTRLVVLGVDASLANKRGRTPIHTYSCFGSNRLKRDGHDPLSLCSQDNIDALDEDGMTALRLAVAERPRIAVRLLQKGADACFTTTSGENLFHAAAKHERADLLLSLAEAARAQAGHDKLRQLINARDDNDRSPLFYAFQSGCSESVDILLIRSDTFFAYPATLDQVLPIIGSWGPSDADIEEAAGAATRKDHLYSARKLQQLGTNLGYSHERNRQQSPQVGDPLESTERAATTDFKVPECAAGNLPESFHYFMANRDHTLALESITEEQLLAEGDEAYQWYTLAHDLAKGGYASMLSKLLTPRILRLLEDARRKKPEGMVGDTLLMAACRRSEPNMAVIKLLVEHLHVDVNAKATGEADPVDKDDGNDIAFGIDPYYKNLWPIATAETALHILAKGGSEWHGILAIQYLCAHGADANVLDKNNSSPLELAIDAHLSQDQPSTSVVRELLRCGAKTEPLATGRMSVFLLGGAYDDTISEHLLSSTETYSSAALMNVIRVDNSVAVEKLLKEGVDVNEYQLCLEYPERSNPKPHYLSTFPPLFWAYIRRYDLTTKHNGPSSTKLPQSTLAALERNQRIINTLLANGADPNADLHNYWRPGTGLAVRSTVYGLLERYSDDQAPDSPFNAAVLAFLQLPALRQLDQALLQACSLRTHTCFKALLDRDVDISTRDSDGRGALHFLVGGTGKSKDVFSQPSPWDLLLQVPELINSPDIAGEYPIHVAAAKSPGCIPALVAAGADPWVVNGAGENILHTLCSKLPLRFTPTVMPHLLGLSGAASALSTKATDKDECTPMWKLFGSDGANLGGTRWKEDDRRWTDDIKPCFDLVKAAEADFAALNNKGQSLLHLTAKKGSVLTFQYLMDRGLDPRLEDNMQRTPLDIAAEHNSERILKLFASKGGSAFRPGGVRGLVGGLAKLLLP